MLKMTIDDEEVVSKNNFTIKEEMLSPSSTILNNTYPKTWENDKDYTSRFYYPKDYAKLNIQKFSITPEEAGTTIQVNGSATLTDVDTTKESRVLKLLGQTSQNGTPTPSSPIPVNVVSGDNEINICGKNLLLLSNDNVYINALQNPDIATTYDVTRNRVDYVVNSVPQTYSQAGYYYSFKTIIGKTYKVKSKWANTSGTPINNTRICSDTSGTTIINNMVSETEYTFTATQETYYFRVWISPNLGNGYVEYAIVSTNDTTYEPYIGNTYPIYLGVENLLDISNITSGNGITNNDNKSITLNGNFTSKSFTLTTPFTLKANITYTLSITNTNNAYSQSTFILRNGSTNKHLINYNVKSVSFTPTQDEVIDTIRLYNGGATFDNFTFSVQLEVGSKANSYTPYGTIPIELCKIGTYQDYIYKDNGSWYLHKEIGKVVLDGSESWNYSSGNVVFYSDVIKPFAIPSNFLCNYYEKIDNSITFGNMTNGTAKYENNVNARLIIKDTRYTNVSDYTTWLSTHNTNIYYVLATPTNTEITDTTLISQLDALESQ